MTLVVITTMKFNDKCGIEAFLKSRKMVDFCANLNAASHISRTVVASASAESVLVL
jgi:hypothetical protein